MADAATVEPMRTPIIHPVSLVSSKDKLARRSTFVKKMRSSPARNSDLVRGCSAVVITRLRTSVLLRHEFTIFSVVSVRLLVTGQKTQHYQPNQEADEWDEEEKHPPR